MKIMIRLLFSFLLFSLVSSMLISCRSLSRYNTDSNGISSDFTEGFENYVLGYTGDVLITDNWERSYIVEPAWMRVTWLDHYEGAMATLNYQDFELTDIELRSYYSEDNIKKLFFGEYNNLQEVESCQNKTDGLVLHEFTGEVGNTDYLIRFWEILNNESFFLDFTLVFPAVSNGLIDKYSEEIFPELPACLE